MPELTTVGAALDWARTLGGEAGRASLEAQILLAHRLHVARAQVLAHPETPLEAITAQAFARDFSRLASGEPLAYLTGLQEFYGLALPSHPTFSFRVPRPS
jgi:release factor glutamine methyltransferase